MWIDIERDFGLAAACLALLTGADWADTSLHWEDTMESVSALLGSEKENMLAWDCAGDWVRSLMWMTVFMLPVPLWLKSQMSWTLLPESEIILQ